MRSWFDYSKLISVLFNPSGGRGRERLCSEMMRNYVHCFDSWVPMRCFVSMICTIYVSASVFVKSNGTCFTHRIYRK